MGIDLIGLLKQHASGVFVEKASALLGESPEAVEKGLLASSTGLLDGVMNKLSGAGAEDMFKSFGDGSKLDKLQNHLAGGNETVKFLSENADKARALLGDDADTAVQSIAATSGLRIESVSSLMGMAQPLVMGVLGKQVASGLDLDGIKAMLNSQMGAISGVSDLSDDITGSVSDLGGKITGGAAAAMAAGAVSSVNGVLKDAGSGALEGATDLSKAAKNLANELAGGAELKVSGDVMKSGKSGLGKLFPIAAVLALIAGAWFFINKGGDMPASLDDVASKTANMVNETASTALDNASETAGNIAGTVGDAADALGDAGTAALGEAGAMVNDTVKGVAADAGDLTSGAIDGAGKLAGDAMKAVASMGEKIGDKLRFSFPDGTSVDVPEGSFEADMLKGLASGDDSVIGSVYILDRVYFSSGSSELTNESRSQITGLATVLNAYPDLKVGLRGHTDSQGSVDKNFGLSTRRAAAVKAALVKLSIADNRLSTKGRGSAEPIADNNTSEGRAKNRRIDFSLTK